MKRKEKQRRQNIVTICEALFKKTQMSYTLLHHAEDIAEETLSNLIVSNGVIIYSVNNKPEYIRNRRRLLRVVKRASEIKPYQIVWLGDKAKLVK